MLANCMRSAVKAANSLLLLVSQTVFHMQPCALARHGDARGPAFSSVLDHASNTRVVLLHNVLMDTTAGMVAVANAACRAMM